MSTKRPNMRIPTQEEVARTNERYEGKRIELIEMPEDPHPIEPGTKGTVEMVDGIGQLMMKWDDGRTLSLIPGVDKFKIVGEEHELVDSALCEKCGFKGTPLCTHPDGYYQDEPAGLNKMGENTPLPRGGKACK